jgi:tetratricopeptide (TPR) repeat protein
MNYYYYYIYKYFIKVIKQSTLLIVLLLSYSLVKAQDQVDIQLANEYLLKGEKQKALVLFQDLAKKQINIPVIHNNYLNTLIDQGKFSDAQEYLKKNLKREPENLQYKLDAGLVLLRSGDVQKADREFKELIEGNKIKQGRVKSMSDYFMARSLFDYSILCLQDSRVFLQNPGMYCLELATLYRIKGEKEKMTIEYLNYATQNVGNNQYIKNVLQVLLTKQDELETLEKILYEKVQRQPEEEVYNDLLIWVTLQQKNFYAAFVQARAFDKRYKTQGTRSMEVAQVALENKDYANAARIYKYVISNFTSGENLQQAQLGYLRAREKRVRGVYPIQRDSVSTLVVDYEKFIAQNPKQPVALEALRNVSVIQANYLHQPDTAIKNLTKLINNAYASAQLKAKAKIDLADIYVAKEEPWESALLYAQVEKTQKENTIGYEAKLKNAKLSYFKGDFQLAQEHLDILKQATTREIANDAMELSMRIKENIALDSAGLALREFAQTELLLIQNKTEEALEKLHEIEQGFSTSKVEGKNMFNESTTTFSNYAIKDDCYWLEAKIQLQKNEPEMAITLLLKIIEEYPTDILADDAFFTIGEIYESHLNDKPKAMEQYQKLMAEFPGSVFVAEARKRFRELRGDFSRPKTAL